MDIRPASGPEAGPFEPSPSDQSVHADGSDLKLFFLGLLISPIGIVIWHHDRKITPKRAASALYGVLLAIFLYLAIVAFIFAYGKQVFKAANPNWDPAAPTPTWVQ